MVGVDFMREFTIKAHDGLNISAAIFEAENPKALVQIIHGAKEHKERYYDFMQFLNDQGYAVIISDNRGHGASVNEKFPLGYMDGTADIIKDQRLVTKYIKKMYPGKPFYLFGHSFGTLISREYLWDNDAVVDKLVLSGTVNYTPAAAVGTVIGKMIIKQKGARGESKFLQSFLDGKDNSWVVGDEAVLENYRKDPLCCGYMYTNGALVSIFESVSRLKTYNLYRCMNPELPILMISGENDPITGGKKGLEDTIATLKKIGYRHIQNVVYRGMKHEVLNETDHQSVYEEVLGFFEKN